MNTDRETETDPKPVLPENAQPADPNSAESKPSEKKTPMFVIVAGIILTLIVIICLQVDDWSRDLTTNTAATVEDATDIDLRPIDTELAPAELAEQVVKRMRDATRWDVQDSREGEDGSINIHLIHRTLIIGFKDDVHVKITPTEKGSRLSATSQSRVGKGDLGQNPRNIKELIKLIRGQISMNGTDD